MHQESQREHEWLRALVGEWTYESDCDMGPDKPRERTTGVEVVRAFGDFWTVADGQGSSREGSWKSVMTLGYDPAKRRFVGTFVATVMPNLWLYEGSLDEAGRRLTLETEGPNFTDGRIVKYRDVIEVTGEAQRTLSSHVLGDDGQWREFMTMRYRRSTVAAARAVASGN